MFIFHRTFIISIGFLWTDGKKQRLLFTLLDFLLNDWLVEWLSKWLICFLMNQLIDWSTDWLTDRLAYCLSAQQVRQFFKWMTSWLAGWLAGWLTASWLSDRTNWLTDWFLLLYNWCVCGVFCSFTLWDLHCCIQSPNSIFLQSQIELKKRAEGRTLLKRWEER